MKSLDILGIIFKRDIIDSRSHYENYFIFVEYGVTTLLGSMAIYFLV